MRQIEDLMVAIFKRLQVTVSNVTLTFFTKIPNNIKTDEKIPVGKEVSARGVFEFFRDQNTTSTTIDTVWKGLMLFY